ncbi:MAG: SMP-30/gluconolactonase/LRE family protein [Deltaproteobacteria bacterium]|nr:SMP-30/gluconolactonase/LRE family protein [Deltaproteobacteria bacterium]
MMVRRTLQIAGVVAVLVGGWFIWLLWITGEYSRLEPHFDGSCVQVLGVVGAEDITIHPEGNVAYLSAHDRRAVDAGRPGHGGLYAYDLSVPVPRLRDLTPNAPPDFRPHGLSLLRRSDGPDRLFVINHAGGEQSIEIYDLTDERLIHRETIRDKALISPNDIVAVDQRRFYVTNDHGSPPGLRETLEDYLRLPLANVLYYDGKSFQLAATGLRFANGINRSADGRRIYVAAMIDRALFVYDRDEASGALHEQQRIDLGTGVDNIELDERGRLWIGAHPKLLTLAKNAGDPSAPAPAQVIRVDLDAAGGPSVEEIFLDPGYRIAAATVAAVRDGRMLIGAVWDDRFLDCRLSPPPP